MCGILAILAASSVHDDEIKQLLKCIDRRGPDYCSPLLDHETNCEDLGLRLKSSVLHLRGDTCQRQPLIDSDGNILMFNGQIYRYSGSQLELHQSDTTFLAGKLQQCRQPEEVLGIFTEIEGPFAFTYWHKNLKKLFYGRDLFGRKSLCVLKDTNSSPVIISSVASNSLETLDRKWSEVRCSGIHCIDYALPGQVKELTFQWDLDSIYPRTAKCEPTPENTPGELLMEIKHLKPLNKDMTAPHSVDSHLVNEAVGRFESSFLEAVSSRYRFNRDTCLLCRKGQLHGGLNGSSCEHAKVAVAFSGGIDSTLIAMALDKVIDKSEIIDLVTVAFQPNSPDRESVGSAFKELRKLSPQRKWRLILCDITKVELEQQRDKRIRDLILPCDSVFDDGLGCACWFVGRAQGRAILSTLPDDWMFDHFSAFLDYDPVISSCETKEIDANYKSPASMLFVGSSIDEQLGGYSSHRRAWSESGAEGLLHEVSFLMRRLSSRNLGRDDRVYCDHGRDLKLPFLDHQFVSLLNEMPLGIKMNLDEPLDVGPKKILRKLAYKWGLEETSRRNKRAMQFGTRIANLEGTKERGNDVCSRLRLPNASLVDQT